MASGLGSGVGEPADRRRIQPFPQAHRVPAGAWGPALTAGRGMAQALLDWERHSHGCSPSRPQGGTTCLCVSIRPPRACPLLSKAFLPGAVRPGCEQPKRDRGTGSGPAPCPNIPNKIHTLHLALESLGSDLNLLFQLPPSTPSFAPLDSSRF